MGIVVVGLAGPGGVAAGGATGGGGSAGGGAATVAPDDRREPLFENDPEPLFENEPEPSRPVRDEPDASPTAGIAAGVSWGSGAPLWAIAFRFPSFKVSIDSAAALIIVPRSSSDLR